MSSCPDSIEKLKVEGLKKSFQNTDVIDGVSLYLKKNEFVSLLGLSGSGKTTIFNIISGLMMPDEGRVLIDGENFTGRTGRVGYMYQDDLLLPWKKVIDNIGLPLVLKGESVKNARARAMEYLPIFGLEGFEYKYPFQLSGGMRQRASLLRTYMFQSDIMLLDEPFGGLDAITRSKMQSWLLKVFESLKISVLLITHDIEEALLLSDRIYVLSERPASIREEVIVEFPKPRDKDIVTTEGFNIKKRHIMRLFENDSIE